MIAQQKRGFTLILALVLMALAAGLLSTVTSAVCSFARQGALEADRVVLRQMIDSGAAWGRLHRTDLRPGEPVTLDVTQLVPRSRVGTLTLAPETDGHGVVIGARFTATLLRPNGMVQHDSAAISY